MEDKETKMLLKISLKNGIFFAFIAIIVSSLITDSTPNFITLLIIPLMTLFLSYCATYLSTLKTHESLIEKYGDQYLELYNRALSEKGIKQLVREDWFYKTDKNGISDNKSK